MSNSEYASSMGYTITQGVLHDSTGEAVTPVLSESNMYWYLCGIDRMVCLMNRLTH